MIGINANELIFKINAEDNTNVIMILSTALIATRFNKKPMQKVERPVSQDLHSPKATCMQLKS